MASAKMPFTAGSSLLLGSKTTTSLLVGLRSGRVLRILSGAAGVPTRDVPLGGEEVGEFTEATVVISRSDFVVRAFDRDEEGWNVSVSEVSSSTTLLPQRLEVRDERGLPALNFAAAAAVSNDRPSVPQPSELALEFSRRLRLSRSGRAHV